MLKAEPSALSRGYDLLERRPSKGGYGTYIASPVPQRKENLIPGMVRGKAIWPTGLSASAPEGGKLPIGGRSFPKALWTTLRPIPSRQMLAF